MNCAVVTGGSKGIGRAISIKLAEMGFHVLINYHADDAAAENTLHEIKGLQGSADLIRFDVGNADDVQKVLGRWIVEHADCPVQVLVNNAGFSRDQLMIWMKNEDWDDVIDVHLNAFFYVTRLILKEMLVNKYGRIINIVSLSGQKGHAGQVNYSAAKAGVIGATKALAQEVGKRMVTVNAVAPGFIKTAMTENQSEKDFKELIPLKRFGEPEEVAEVVGFLASEKSSYITGEVISVNGGLYT
ncbi:3-oxoacyl-ACP reductase FabG [bacterium]|nr:3-oxoacyl-ACP reductase FabG [bacterium]